MQSLQLHTMHNRCSTELLLRIHSPFCVEYMHGTTKYVSDEWSGRDVLRAGIIHGLKKEDPGSMLHFGEVADALKAGDWGRESTEVSELFLI